MISIAVENDRLAQHCVQLQRLLFALDLYLRQLVHWEGCT